MKPIRYIFFVLCIVAACFTCAYSESEGYRATFTYGESEQGRELICQRVGSEDASRSILIVFGLHGFEDAYDRDGEVLRLIAEQIIAHYEDLPELLRDFCLYVIPTANPDGLMDGTTKDGFGRCNAKGLDINRDFPVRWTKKSTARNKTGDAPFSTAEARAIRDLVEAVKPTYGIDIHGWIKASYGKGTMADVFAKPFKFVVKEGVSGGMLFQWLDEVTEEGIMIELPPNPDTGNYVMEQSEKLIQGIDAWIAYCCKDKN